MPRLTSADSPINMPTSSLAAADLPTSANKDANKNWQKSKTGATDYGRREYRPRFGTAGIEWDEEQGNSFATGANITSIADSQFDASSGISPTPTSYIVGLQKWVGQIHSVKNGLFTAELLPLDHDGPTLFADFELRLLAPDEREAKPGAIVYLTTRMIQGDSGHMEAVTNLRLRQPRRWSRAELSEVKRRGRDRARSFASYVHRGTKT